MRHVLEVGERNWRAKTPVQQISNRQLKLLDLLLTHRKHSTSHFLIDNFQGSLDFRSSPTSKFRLPISCSPNRQSPELETDLSHRKQKTENFLIANFRPMLRSPNQPSVANLDPRCQRIPDSRLSPLNCKLPSLIANEAHSREESSNRKQST
jgi:hypothetical protein